jgi:hypothetical protein
MDLVAGLGFVLHACLVRVTGTRVVGLAVQLVRMGPMTSMTGAPACSVVPAVCVVRQMGVVLGAGIGVLGRVIMHPASILPHSIGRARG